MPRQSNPFIYHLPFAVLGSAGTPAALLRQIKAMGFDVVYLGPADLEHVSPAEPADIALIQDFATHAAVSNLEVMIDIILSHVSDNDPLRQFHPEWFAAASFDETPAETRLDWSGPHAESILEHYVGVLAHYVKAGVRGFRFPWAWRVPHGILRQITTTVHAMDPVAFCCAEALGRPESDLRGFQGTGLDYIFDSAKWWDGKSPWFLGQQTLLQAVAPTIGFPESAVTLPAQNFVSRHHDGARDLREDQNRYLRIAAFSAGIMMPAGYEGAIRQSIGGDVASEDRLHDISDFITFVNRLKLGIPALAEDGPIEALARSFDAVQGYARRSKDGHDLVFILVNTDRGSSYSVDLDWLLAPLTEIVDLEDVTPGAPEDALDQQHMVIPPDGVRLLRAHHALESSEPEVEVAALTNNAPPSRVVIEAITPDGDSGNYAIKRIVGDDLRISADIFRDGHDLISAVIRLKEAGQTEWRLAPMRLVDNDRWSGSIPLRQIGQAQYSIEAWTDHFASWRLDVSKKRLAGQAIAMELVEGQNLISQTIDRAASPNMVHSERQLRGVMRLRAIIRRLDELADDDARADLLLSHFVLHAVSMFPDKTDRQIYKPALDLVVDRETARFSTWYEMFPRSQGTNPDQGATFADCTKRLPEIRDLGFDVLYLVPIHPIGQINRKGRHNSLIAGAGDPGSPYAIGSKAGGHTAIDPELGTLDDFRAFHDAVHDNGMELAMDFAVQCAPDHPWVTEFPHWFRRRPDGTIKFAENPPKKYEDIVNIDFDAEDWHEIWIALRDAVLFWVNEGVRIFRIDNPHTKPVPFWQWLIAEVKRYHPDVLFLAEAFTRPKMMKRLAKIGFTQSYSYFTWRNTKTELTEYLTELTQGPSSDYMQPNFFANTPDILPSYLQTGGRAAFRIRLALAATLSPTYGIYNGFELCEAAAVPGKEEYADSEKYTYKVWAWDQTGHIKDDIVRLNTLRRESSALHSFTNLNFSYASHPQILFYTKTSMEDGDTVFVAVNLDPFNIATADISFPFDALGLSEDSAFETVDIFTGEYRHWQGRHHRITLDPAVQPAMILRLAGGAAHPRKVH